MPIDGEVIEGSGFANESMLTGESQPVPKDLKDNVYGGTLLTKGTILVRVTKTTENAAINQIMKLVEQA